MLFLSSLNETEFLGVDTYISLYTSLISFRLKNFVKLRSFVNIILDQNLTM